MPSGKISRPVGRRSWKEFQDAGLLWWVNRGLHLFGWSIVFDVDMADPGNPVLEVYPARVAYRGFTAEVEEEGFAKLTLHLVDEGAELLEDLADG